ncbi:MAG: hypothetical protein ACRD3V_19110 [Vicinamibacteria bacterium]
MATLNVRLALTGLLSKPTNGPPGVNVAEGQSEPNHEPDFESALQALLAVDALSPEEAELWRERFHRLGAASAEEMQTTRARLEETATRLIQELRQECSQTGGDDREDKMARANFALDALHQIDLLSEEELFERVEEFNRLLGLPDEPENLIEGPQLQRVDRVIAGPANRILGMRITAIALCEDGLIVHWHRLRESQGPDVDDVYDEVEFPPELEIEDDVDTEYDPHGGGSGGGGEVETGNAEFEPAVPKEAELLRISLDEEGWEIPLR